MDKLWRMKWNRKEEPKKWFYGPVLYLTNREHPPFNRVLRPYTLGEAMKAAIYFNKHYTRGLHVVEEVKLDERDNVPRGTTEQLEAAQA